jgi:hypothetical protein
MDEFEEVYERQLAPLLRPHGLQALRGGDPGGGGHPSAGAPGCGLASGAAATATDVWDGARPWAALAFRYRTPTGPGHTTAAKGTSAEAGTGNRLGVWHTLDLSDGLPSGTVQSVCQDRQGQMWFGSIGGGVSRYDGELFTTFTTRDGLAGNDVLCILEDRSGRLWVGTADGVSRWDGQRFVNFSPDYEQMRED